MSAALSAGLEWCAGDGDDEDGDIVACGLSVDRGTGGWRETKRVTSYCVQRVAITELRTLLFSEAKRKQALNET